MINRERVQLLVDALRSNEFIQGQGTLERIKPDGARAHCCLGVACRVAMANGARVTITSKRDSINKASRTLFDGNEYGLPGCVIDWYGFAKGDPNLTLEGGQRSNAIDCNDYLGLGFHKIADAFERTYLND